MTQRMIMGGAGHKRALCYAETVPQQIELSEKLTGANDNFDTPPSYVSIAVRAGICLLLIGLLVYGINRAMAVWLA